MVYTFNKEGVVSFVVPDVLVYNMGKVGSTSIAETIMESGFKRTLKSHWMAHNYPIAEFWTERKYLMEAIRKGQYKPFKVVIPVREPMARNISAFFQLLNEYVVDFYKKTARELHSIFMEVYNVEFPDQWFSLEPMGVLGFDPYSIPFDYSMGYQMYDQEHKYLVIRLEDCDRILTEALRELLDVDNIQMKHSNPRKKVDKTKVEDLYAEFKTFKYPKEFIDRTYALKYVRHFYSKEEIENYKDRWSE